MKLIFNQNDDIVTIKKELHNEKINRKKMIFEKSKSKKNFKNRLKNYKKFYENI